MKWSEVLSNIKGKKKSYPEMHLQTEMCMFKLIIIFFFKGIQMCTSGRSRPNVRRTAGLIAATKAGTTTTTTPRRRCCHCGTPVTQPCVTACEPAGEFWAKNIQKEKSNSKMSLKTCRNIKETCRLFLHRCHQQHIYGPACTYGPTPPLSALPGHDYAQPLLPQNPESAKTSGPPPQYFGPPQSSYQTLSPGMDHISAARPGSLWQHGGQQSSLSALNLSTTDMSNMGNTNPAKEFSIRIISV